MVVNDTGDIMSSGAKKIAAITGECLLTENVVAKPNFLLQ